MSGMRKRDLQKANLLYDAEAIIIVAMEYIGTHKREYGHDVVQNGFWGNTSEAGNKQ
jgi:hypothetical protein